MHLAQPTSVTSCVADIWGDKPFGELPLQLRLCSVEPGCQAGPMPMPHWGEAVRCHVWGSFQSLGLGVGLAAGWHRSCPHPWHPGSLSVDEVRGEAPHWAMRVTRGHHYRAGFSAAALRSAVVSALGLTQAGRACFLPHFPGHSCLSVALPPHHHPCTFPLRLCSVLCMIRELGSVNHSDGM